MLFGNVLGERLRGLRHERGITQKKMADEFGITVVGYQNYEAGRRNPSFYMIQRLADFFCVSLDYLCGRIDEPCLPDKETLKIARELQAYRSGNKQSTPHSDLANS